jgi:hypothetical protein
MLLAALLLPPAATAQERSRIDRVKSIVVMIQGQKVPGGGHPFFGAGIIIARDGDDLIVLTRYHIIHNDSGAPVASIKAATWWRQDAWLPAMPILGKEHAGLDLALLRIPGAGRGPNAARGPDFAVLGDAHAALPLTDVYAVGYPNLQAWFLLPCPEGFATLYPNGAITFTSSDVHPGLSGGVLLDSRKRVIGIVKSDDGTSGYALAIDRVLEQLRSWHQPTDLRLAAVAVEDSDPGLAAQDRTAKQTRLLDAQLQPQFRFVQTRTTIGSETVDSLELWNDGPAVESYQVVQRTYLQVAGASELVPAVRYIPTYYFRDRHYQQNAKTGLLATFLAWQEGVAGHPGLNETKEYEKLAADVGRRFAGRLSITKRVFMVISYVDHAKADHLLVYEIYPFVSFGPTAPTLVREELNLRMVLARSMNEMNPDKVLQIANSALALTDLGENHASP